MQATTEPNPTRTAKTWTVTERTPDGNVIVHENMSHIDYVSLIQERVHGIPHKPALRSAPSVAPAATEASPVPLAA